MIIAEHHRDGMVRFTLRPNRSLDWRGSLEFFAWMSAVSLSIAAWFAWQGAWLVLPFAGLELAALALGLYMVSVRCMDKEIVSINEDTVEICKGRRHLESRILVRRHWAQVRLEAGEHRWYPGRLIIRSHGRGTEIGRFLGEVERRDLARTLRKIV